MTALTGAAVVAGVVGGLWLLTCVVQLAAYAMFAVAWAGWLAVRAAAVAAGGLLALWLLAFGSAQEQVLMRRAWREGRARRQRAGAMRQSSPPFLSVST